MLVLQESMVTQALSSVGILYHCCRGFSSYARLLIISELSDFRSPVQKTIFVV